MKKTTSRLVAMVVTAAFMIGCVATKTQGMVSSAENEVRSRGDCPDGCTLKSEVKRIDSDWTVVVNVIQPDGNQELSGRFGVIFDDVGKMKGYLQGF